MESDTLCLDWGADLATARTVLGPQRGVSGNLDPSLLFAPEVTLRAEV